MLSVKLYLGRAELEQAYRTGCLHDRAEVTWMCSTCTIGATYFAEQDLPAPGDEKLWVHGRLECQNLLDSWAIRLGVLDPNEPPPRKVALDLQFTCSVIDEPF
jgi:hypothetical protein